MNEIKDEIFELFKELLHMYVRLELKELSKEKKGE